jgi:hypothetical protein
METVKLTLKKYAGISLLTTIIMLVSLSTATQATSVVKHDFLNVNVLSPQIPPGATETLEISLTNMDCEPVTYAMFVFSPGDLQLLEDEGHDFIGWLTSFSGSSSQFWIQLEGWKTTFQSLSLDIGVVGGFLTNHNPSHSWIYPTNFIKIVGNLGTFDQGEYDVVAVGVGVHGCFCFYFCFDCFHTSFFVVPEIPLGTIAPIVSSLGSLSFLGMLTKRRKHEK